MSANTGTISGGLNGRGIDARLANVVNSGVISARDAISANTANVANTNTGAILGGVNGIGINAVFANVSNSGVISGGQAAINVSTAAAVDNSGRILATDGNGVAIGSSGSADVVNRAGGRISGGTAAIFADTIGLNNAGTVISTGENSFGLFAVTVNVSANTGTISGGSNGRGINATFANVANSGVISAGQAAINVSTAAAVDNSGRILATNANGIAINSSGSADVVNRAGGRISGGVAGILAANTIGLNNAGTVISTGDNGVGLSAVTVNVSANTGTISGGSNGRGIDATLIANRSCQFRRDHLGHETAYPVCRHR